MRAGPLLGTVVALVALAILAGGSPPSTRAAPVGLGGTPKHLCGGPRWYERFAQPVPRSERPLITLMLRYHNELGLSSEQVQALERLRADFQREVTRREAELRAVETDLMTLLDADPVDLGQIEAKLRAIESQRADLRLARIRTIEQGKAVLTPEQRTKLWSLLPSPRFWPYAPGEGF